MKKPILGTIILTDACNLSCAHCAVNNLTGVMHPYSEVYRDMLTFYRDGIRILFFCGGETMLWRDSGKDIHDLISAARKIGFYLVNVVTNGTLGLELPDASVVFLSLDGMKKTHNSIRGDSFDLIMENLEHTNGSNICLYSAINRRNIGDMRDLAALARGHPAIRSISFNLHTPYQGTEHLALDPDDRIRAVQTLRALIAGGYPVFNLATSLAAFAKNDWPRPCYQCVVSEAGRRYVCGRCVEIDGLCDQCGYLFAAEFALLFRGNPRVIAEMLQTYRRYA